MTPASSYVTTMQQLVLVSYVTLILVNGAIGLGRVWKAVALRTEYLQAYLHGNVCIQITALLLMGVRL
jgi:hypothetical protein